MPFSSGGLVGFGLSCSDSEQPGSEVFGSGILGSAGIVESWTSWIFSSGVF